MCNAWNHPPDCPCSFGGGNGGLNISSINTIKNTINDYVPDDRVTGNAKFKYRDSHASLRTEDAKTYPRKCFWCNGDVFHHTNGYGDCVLFDSLGKPWLVHSCWTQYWEEEKERRKKYESCYPSRKFDTPLEKPLVLRRPEEFTFNDIEQARIKHDIKQLIFQGAIQSIESAKITLSVENLAAQMGISIEELQVEYGDFYHTS